jgi:hypothetical protein
MGEVHDPLTPAKTAKKKSPGEPETAIAPPSVPSASQPAVPIGETTTSAVTRPAASESDEVAATVEHIARTRDEMADTIHAIQERLTPAHIVEDVKDHLKQSATDKIHDVGHKVSQTAHQVGRTIDEVAVRANAQVDQAAEALCINIDRAAKAAKRTGLRAIDAVERRPVLAVVAAGLVASVLLGWPLHRAARRRVCN